MELRKVNFETKVSEIHISQVKKTDLIIVVYEQKCIGAITTNDEGTFDSIAINDTHVTHDTLLEAKESFRDGKCEFYVWK